MQCNESESFFDKVNVFSRECFLYVCSKIPVFRRVNE